MEVQSQTPVANVTPSATAGSTATSTSNGSANGTQTQGSFSTTLDVMMSGSTGQQSVAAIAGLSGIPALIQLLTPLLSATPATDVQATALTVEQVDALTQLLQEPEQAESLLSNPDLQAWLMQIQASLAVIAPAPTVSQSAKDNVPTEAVDASGAEAASTILSSLLFVPIQNANQPVSDTTAVNTVQEPDHAQVQNNSVLSPLLFTPLLSAGQAEPANNSAAVDRPQEQVITQGQAVHLLKQLKVLIQSAQNHPELKQILKELPSVLVTAAVETGHLHKNFNGTSRLTQVVEQGRPFADVNPATVADLVQVVQSKVQTLEIMAAKAVHPNHLIETQTTNDEPLFEPLIQTDISGQNAQPITVQEFMKQVQAGHAPKMPVLQMPAAAFSDDMTQFVVSSFMMESSIEGFTEAKISLYPQHLGHVDVKLTMHNGQLVAQFVADSLVGKEMLESQLPQLRTTLQSQGIQVEKLEVSQGQGYQSGMFQDSRQQQSGQSSKQQKSASARIAALDEVVTEEAVEAAAAVKLIGNGSIDITA